IVTTVTARLNDTSTGLLYDATGQAADAMSGLGTEVMLLAPGTSVQYDGPTYPPGAGAASFSFTEIPSALSLTTFDRSGWSAYYNLQTSEIPGTFQVTNRIQPSTVTIYSCSIGLGGNVGTILKTARLTTGDLLVDRTITRFITPPTGMRVELWAESSGEGLSPDVPPYIPLVYGYGRTEERRLFTGRGFDSQSDTFNLPMKEDLTLCLESYGNTNTGLYEVYIDSDSDGDMEWVRGEYKAGTFHLEADGWATASAQNLSGMAHFYQWIPVGDIQRLETGRVSLEIRGVTQPGVITVDTARRTLSQPDYKMAGEDHVYEIKTDAEFTGPMTLFMGVNHPSHTDRQSTSPVIMHCPAGPDACEWLATTSDGFTAKAVLPSLSPFGIMVPLDDVTPPRTEFALIGERQYSENQFLVTPETYVDLTADDRANIGDVSGVAGTYALLDHEPATECLAAPYDPAAPAGTCANPRYGGIFPVPEGAHTVYYASYDHWGNREEFRSRALLSDGTPPRTELLWNLGGEVVYCGDTPCLGPSDKLGLNATDPVSGGVSSSVDFIALLIDVLPENCGGFDELDPQAPLGTCLNPVYTGPFAMPAGPHTLYYFSVDKAGNFELANSTPVFVDDIPPVVTLSADGVEVPDGGEAFLAAGTSITLTAFDPVDDGYSTGIYEAEYLIDVTFDSCPPEEEGGEGEEGEEGEDEEDDGPRGTCGNSGYEGPFTLTPGTHTVYYLAHDMVMNASAVRTAYFTVAPSSGAAEASITPSSGPIGLPFTITGEGFGTYSAGTTVTLIGGSTAPLTLWTDTQIKGTVPGSLAAGEYPVVVQRGAELLAETSSFTVVVPALAEIAPSSGPIGLPFT
ncbi:MAG TPA: IPT/TIG domain-containing protein, partial [Elusimicrobiales bacterium]|nr:IPT/TIG domain-containing protein [Elusimicrobiales bacterium]